MESAYLATAAEWSAASTVFVAWVGNEHGAMGAVLQGILKDPEGVDVGALGVPEGGAVPMAVGTLMKTTVFGLLEGHSKMISDEVLD